MRLDLFYLLLFIVNLSSWLAYYFSAFWYDKQRAHWGNRLLYLGFFEQTIAFLAEYVFNDQWTMNEFASLFLVFSFLSGMVFVLIFNSYHGVPFNRHRSLINTGVMLLSGVFGFYGYAGVPFLVDIPLTSQILGFIHNVLLKLSYILFGVASIVAVIFIRQEKQIKKKTIILKVNRLPSLGKLNVITYRTLLVGFVFFSIGIPAGFAISTQSASSFLTVNTLFPPVIWTVYFLYLVRTHLNGNKGRPVALGAIFGFSLVLIFQLVEFGALAAII